MKSNEIQKKVTDKILNLMKSGQCVWAKEWSGARTMYLPKNGLTGNKYKGVNFWNLAIESEEKGFFSGEWVTFVQLQDLSKKHNKQLKIKKGSKAENVIFYKLLEKSEINQETKELEKKETPILKYSNVFNLSQIEGLEDEILKKSGVELTNNNDLHIDLGLIGASFEHAAQDRAFYSPVNDVVTLPMREQFKSASAYYATAFHELIHWTGHESRLNRKKGSAFGSKDYAFEELIAEFGASFLCAEFGIDYETQHAGYLSHWVKILENDETLLFKAIGQAQKAADFLLNKMIVDEELQAASENLTQNEINEMLALES